MQYLRTNTATRITVGPFLDKTDGITPEVALTVTNCKLTFVVDDGGVPTLVLDVAPTASGGSNDMIHITNDDAGFYDLELAAANVNYLGRARLAITDAANHCPVFCEFMILPAVVYDAMILGTDLLDVNMTQILGTAVSTPATAGILDINVKNMNNVAATSITTINANQGTTQPINFTGTGASAYAKSDVVDIAGAAVATGTAQLGVNVVSQDNIDFGALQKASLNAATPASVTGAVGSVTGAVGSVTGSVGSVAANGITATSIAADAINADAVKADAVTKIQNGLATPTNITAGTITTVTNLTNLPAAAATAAELAKVPKSDSNVTWNATALASINAEVDTALNTAIPGSPTADSINERIVAIDAYGAPPSAATVADAVWDEAIADHAGVGSTGAALAAATAPSAATVADAVWDELLAGHVGAGTAGAALGLSGDPMSTAVPGSYAAGTAGYQIGNMATSTPGANQVTITVQEADLTPIPDVAVRILNSAQTALLKTGTTDSLGQVVVSLNDGSYKIRLAKGMVNFTVPETLTVSGTTTKSCTGTIITPTVTSPTAQALIIIPDDLNVIYNPDAVIYAEICLGNNYSGTSTLTREKIYAVDHTTYFQIDVAQGETVRVVGAVGDNVFLDRVITITTDATKNISAY